MVTKAPGKIAMANGLVIEVLRARGVYLYHRYGFDFDPKTGKLYFEHSEIDLARRVIPTSGWMTGDELKDYWTS